MRPEVAAVLRPLPRRAVRRATVSPLWRAPTAIPRPALRSALVRSVRWCLGGVAFLARVAVDRLRGRGTHRRVGAHLRGLFESMGATGTKLGQQLSIRVDLLPFEVCDELARLTDRAEPIPLEVAVREIEACIGGPLHTRFQALDPEPIGAASIACVYRGVLLTGEHVAVKVQRPEVGQRFADDLFAFDLMTGLMELVGAVRPDFFKFMRADLKAMFLEELDFVREYRMQDRFRRIVAREGLDWLTAPRVYPRLSGPRVIVSEFVDAVSCADVVRARESGDAAAAARLREHDIDPNLLGRRIYQLSFWARLEAPFFHADPHPANILVLPGSRVCLIDFGACGMVTRRSAILQRELLDRVRQDDVHGNTQVMLSETGPYPGIDLTAVTNEMERRIWRFQLAILDSRAAWWEKTTAGLWIAMLESAQKYQIPLNLDTLRLIRGTLLYDTLAFRLAPDITVEEVNVFLQDLATRAGRRAVREAEDQRRLGDRGVLDRVERLYNAIQRAGALRPQLLATFGKAAAVGTWVAWSLAGAVLGWVAVVLWEGAHAAGLVASDSVAILGHVAGWIGSHPWVWPPLVAVTAFALLRMYARLAAPGDSGRG